MKKIIVVLLAVMQIMLCSVFPIAAEEKAVTVVLNGAQMQFDVHPIIVNGRTMVPMRAIFEALGAEVYWHQQNESITGISGDGKHMVIAIDSNRAMVDGTPVALDAAPMLKDGRTLVPLRFISESFGAEVLWDDPTYTVTINAQVAEKTETEANNADVYYFGEKSFSQIGCWSAKGDDLLQGKNTAVDAKEITDPNDDALLDFYAPEKKEYNIWVNDRDYAENQPGTRYFNVAVDGVRAGITLGKHGEDGFRWTKIGTYALEEGWHQIAFQDTSSFYARFQGVIVSGDLSYVPSQDPEEYKKYASEGADLNKVVPANYPAFAKVMTQETATQTIENDKIKINFYQGTNQNGSVVHNEVYLNKNGEWVLVKGRTEDFGVLAMVAGKTTVKYARPENHENVEAVKASKLPSEIMDQAFQGLDGEIRGANIREFYKSGYPDWLLPYAMEKTDNKTVLVHLKGEKAEATLTFTFDDLTFEPKVTLKATTNYDGAYSFSFVNGDGFEEGSFDRVTAPLTYVKDFVPDDDIVLAEYMMFTPMATFTFGKGENAVTEGMVVDPTSVRQYVATPGDSDFGVLFRSPEGLVRGQIVAPLFATEKSKFKAGDTFTFAYRLVYNDQDWYENYTHVAQDMYNCVDLRTNYYASLNEAIYNSTDLMMDDMYGGWDPKYMGFYNMEGDNLVTQSNISVAMQRYMLTENEELLEKRAIPTVAYALSRSRTHFKWTEGSNSYGSGIDKLGEAIPLSPSNFIGLYKMSQGRTPYLLNYALTKSDETNLYGTAYWQSINEAASNSKYIEKLKAAADNYLEMLSSEAFNNTAFVDDFVYGDRIPMLNTFVIAYEETGEQKYLDAATEAARLIMAELWTTGYQNDYATTDYTVDPVETAKRHEANGNADWYWHGAKQWRVGNPYGVKTSAGNSQTKLKEETAPGWIPARTGMSTEHLLTPANANAITMNMWPGTILRLAKYTGDEFLVTMARNAMVGRYANYPGYYHERYLLHDKQANYPYEGPDYNLIYWHHIPVFVAMLEDYLINEVWYRSDAEIAFPSYVSSGYAYFISNQYGYAPGKFYDEDEMWLWIDRGIIEPDSVQVNYIAAKKDGVLGLALTNESTAPLTTTITLGEKIPNAQSYSETATLYDNAGNKSTVEIVNGKFTVTIPEKSLSAVVLHPEITKPGFAKDYTFSNSLGETVCTFANGRAYVLQFNDEGYYAYIYTDKMPSEIKSATFEYKVSGKTNSVTVNEYPFEKLIKVEGNTPISFKVKGVTTEGVGIDLGSGTLAPLKPEQVKPFSGEPTYLGMPTFEPFSAEFVTLGNGSGNIRAIVSLDDFPFEVTEDTNLVAAKVAAKVIDKETNQEKILKSTIKSVELRDKNRMLLVIGATKEFPTGKWSDESFIKTTIDILPPNTDLESYNVEMGEVKGAIPAFEPFKVPLTSVGCSSSTVRLVVPTDAFPFEVVQQTDLTDYKVAGLFVNKETGKTRILKTTIAGKELRDNGTMVLVVKPTDMFPTGSWESTSFEYSELYIIPKETEFKDFVLPGEKNAVLDDIAPPEPEPEAVDLNFSPFKVKAVSLGSLSGNIRIVVETAQFPMKVTTNCVKGAKVKGTFKVIATGEVLNLDSEITMLEIRNADTAVLTVKQTDAIKASSVSYDTHQVSELTISPQ